LGRLFRYDYQNGLKTELLIIMTPHIVRNQADAERVKRTEAGRMSWCLSDVVKVHSEAGLRNRSDDWLDREIPTIYPDMDPIGAATGAPAGPHENVPTPNGQPTPANRGVPPQLRFPPPPRARGTPMSSTGRPPAPVRQTANRAPPQTAAQVPLVASSDRLRLRPATSTPATPDGPPAAAAPSPMSSRRRQAPPPPVQQLQYESPLPAAQ
jgi:hypothetical protein